MQKEAQEDAQDAEGFERRVARACLAGWLFAAVSTWMATDQDYHSCAMRTPWEILALGQAFVVVGMLALRQGFRRAFHPGTVSMKDWSAGCAWAIFGSSWIVLAGLLSPMCMR